MRCVALERFFIIAGALISVQPAHAQGRPTPPHAQSTPATQPLGPTPASADSEYIGTATSSFAFFWEADKVSARYTLAIMQYRPLPAGAYLEVTFENPRDAGEPLVVKLPRGAELKLDPFEVYSGTDVGSLSTSESSLIKGAGSRYDNKKGFLIVSPVVEALKCQNYKAVVKIYADASKAQLLGIHEQLIQNRLSTELITSYAQLLEAGQALKRQDTPECWPK
jgi:hypothetical protein